MSTAVSLVGVVLLGAVLVLALLLATIREIQQQLAQTARALRIPEDHRHPVPDRAPPAIQHRT